jgi:hypothetical protein
MRTPGCRNVWLAVMGLVLLGASGPAWAQAPAAPAWASPRPWFVYLVILVVLFGTLVSLILIRSALHRSEWSLADALSEETEVTATVVSAAGQKKPLLDGDKPVTITEMRASTSRLIALMGMMAILLMFLGFGSFSLYSFALTGTMPAQIDKVIYFLMSGMTLFAPYVVNKFASMFESLTPKP